MSERKQPKVHYAWFILLGCCMLQGGTLGAVTNVAGVFYVPVCTELGFSVGQLSLYRTIMGFVALFALPVATKLLKKYDSRVVLTTAALIFILPTLAMSRFTSVTQWYIAGVLQGFGSNFLTIAVAPLILTNWFRKKTGLVIGISTASSGLLGALFNYLISAVIASSGWRTGYLVSGGVALVIVLTATLFILRYKPEDLGMRPYGEEEGSALASGAGSTLEYTPAEYNRRLLTILVAALCAGIAAGFSSSFNAFGLSVGMSITSAAMLASMGMIGNTVGKLIVGELNDRVGTKWPCLLGYGVAMAGALLMLVTREPLIYGSALLFGVSMPVYTTLMPLLTRAALGEKGFSESYSKVTMAASITSSLMFSVHGWLYDFTGSYTCSMLLSAAAMGIGCLISLKLFFLKPKAAAAA